MQKHNKICFFKTPLIYIKDKIEVGLNQTDMLLVAAIPGLFGLFGLVASVFTIFKLSPNTITLTLVWFLFIGIGA